MNSPSTPHAIPRTALGGSDLQVSRICLGTMTFGEQVDEPTAHAILDQAVERDINFIDTAEMYAVPARRETYGATETIIGRWLAARPGMRQRIVLATKVAGPSRGMPWVRDGADDLQPAHIAQACDDSLRRLQTDVIDLYQIHWPNRNAAIFGGLYLDPAKDRFYTSIHDQLAALAKLVQAGKVRHIGLSNESPWGLMEFLRVAEQHGLPRGVGAEPVRAGQPGGRQRPGRSPAAQRRGPAGLQPAGLWQPDRQVRRPRLRPGAAGAGAAGPLREHAQAALGPARDAGGRPALQRAGARARPQPHADGAGLLLWQLARGQHHHRRDHRWPSWTTAWPPGAPPCRPNCWPPSTRCAGSCATRRSDRMGQAVAKKDRHVSETPATQCLRAAGVAFTEHVYDYVDHGGTAESARQLGWPEHAVVKTLVMQDDARAADRADARRPAGQHQEPGAGHRRQERGALQARGGAAPQRLPGGGTSPFGTRKAMPVYVEASVLALPSLLINGGRRGFLVGLHPMCWCACWARGRCTARSDGRAASRCRGGCVPVSVWRGGGSPRPAGRLATGCWLAGHVAAAARRVPRRSWRGPQGRPAGPAQAVLPGAACPTTRWR
jgi:hypothetical protein